MNKYLLLVAIVIASTLFISTPLFSQETLVKDINTTPAGFRPTYDYTELFCQCGDYLFFGVPGKELWRTDGSPEGTISLGDINKGFVQGFQGYISEMTCAEDILYFRANDGLHGWEIWTSDGTQNGTTMLKDVTPGYSENGSSAYSLGLLGDTFYFVADSDNNSEKELWKSNGTASTTVMVPNFPAFTSLFLVMSSDTHHFFRTINPVTEKYELWATDGTGANTTKLSEDFYPGFWANLGEKVMYSFNDRSDNTYSLWISDGTSSGTVMVKDFGTQYLQRFEKFNGKLLFGVYGDTWISDGTEAGTTFLASGYVDASITIDNLFYGFGYDFSSGAYRLLKTDGISVETTDIYYGDLGAISMHHDIPVVGNSLIFQYMDESVGQELGIYNMTTGMFGLIKDINSGVNGSSPRAWSVLNGRTYFLADDGIHGTEIWSTDGTAEGTYMLKHILSGTANAFRTTFGSASMEVALSEGKLQLFAEPRPQKSAIYTSDGTESGTIAKIEFDIPTGTMFGRSGNDLIYFNDRKFYKTNGATEAVTLVKDLSNDVTSLGYIWTPQYSLGNNLIFKFGTYEGNLDFGDEFWITDGTEAGTHILKDINPGSSGGVSNEAALLESKLIFQGTEPSSGSELWITDGTEAGTLLLKDINPGSAGSVAHGFVVFGDKVIFGATEGMHGAEVWITDGTAAGTTLLADIIPGPEGSEARHFRAGSNFVFFSAYDSEKGWTSWRTDGTAEGTLMIADVIPGSDKGKYPINLNAVGDKFYFGASDEVHGQELWVTDGTASGTHIIDIVPGAAGSNPSLVTDINGVSYFKADVSLWRTNGTAQGTFKVSDLEPFNITVLNNWVYFTAMHSEYGIELFKVEFAKLNQEIIVDAVQEKTFGDAPFQISASATSGLPVAITSSDELAITNITATIIKPGTVAITIRQEGDALFNAAEEVGYAFCVLPAKPAITVSGMSTAEPMLTSSSETGNQWFVENMEVVGANDKIYAPEESGTFKVNVTIDGCTSLFSDEEIILITGIEGAEDQLIFYPNPAKDNIKIQATGQNEKMQVDILDLQGKPIGGFQIQPNETVEHLIGSYPPGVYLIKIVTSGTTAYHKFVKE